MKKIPISLHINGRLETLEIPPYRTLLEVLREELHLTGTKCGCEDGSCGTCTVLLNGSPVRSCLLLAAEVQGQEIVTIEGLAQGEKLHPVQEAFVKYGGIQCGFCTPGMILTAKALLDKNSKPTEQEIRQAISGNLCRCTGYTKIVDSIMAASGQEVPSIHKEEFPTPYSVVGKRTSRIDSIPKAKGEAKYSGDLYLPGMLYAKVLRSPYAHAKILHIDVSRAEKLPGVRAIITGKDAPPYRWGVFSYTRDMQFLPTDKARYVGQEVAAVAAISEEIAEEAIHLIQVEWEPLPFVLDPEEALMEGAPQLHDDKPGNISVRIYVNEGNVEQALSESYLVEEGRFSSPEESYCQTENYAVVAHFDSTGLDIWCPNAGPHMKARPLSNALGIPTSNVRVRKINVGGHFGGRSEISPADFIAALLSKKSGRPVKLVYTREENFNCVRQVHGSITHCRVGVDSEGRITAVDMKVIMDGGAYASTGPIAASVAYIMIEGTYKFPNLRYEAIRAYTNKPPRGMYPHHPRTTYAALELLLDSLAERLGMDPLEFRIKNAVHEGYITPTRTVITSCAEVETMRLASERAGWREKRGHLPPYRGIGIGCASMISGFPMGIRGGSAAFVRFNEDGDVIVISGVMDNGQGNDSMIAQIAAEELGIPLERVKVITGDTSVTPSDQGAYSQASTLISGGAVKAAAADAKEQLFEVAAQMLEANKEELVAKEGRIFVKDEPKRFVEISKVARTALAQNRAILGRGDRWPDADPSREWIKNPRGQIASAISFGTAVAEVEVDPETGKVKVLNMVAAHDCGYPINPLAVEQQIQRSAMEGGPQGVLMEKHLWTKDGKNLNANFHDYWFPLATDVPNIEPIIVTSNDPFGPFGAKEGGLSISVAMIGAMANAVRNAIGIMPKELPLTPEVVLSLLEEKRKIK
jgi:CO/xanthine dehydrogenase Mo-binding subunit/aerobic-type carbon monoxide dehydrogenase small subunit (CoxS/CutS family)